MSLLEELVTSKETVRIDFHNHIQSGKELREENPKSFFKRIFGEGFTSLVGLLNKMFKTSLDLLYITNYEDSRAEDWTSPEQLQLAVQNGYEIEQGEYYTFFKKYEEVKGIGKSQEVPTTQGHALFSGMKRHKKIPSARSLDETLARANDNELKTADHAYTIIEKSGTLRNSKNPKEDAKKFDALEENGNFAFFSFPFSIANYLAKKFSKRYNKPLVANSDGHHPKDIGETYNILDSQNLNYTSERAFRDSINYEIREGNFTTRFRPIPFWRVFHHIFMVGVYTIRDKLYKIKERVYAPSYEPALAPA